MKTRLYYLLVALIAWLILPGCARHAPAPSALAQDRFVWAFDGHRYIYARGNLWYAVVEQSSYPKDSWSARAWGDNSPGRLLSMNNPTAEDAKRAVEMYFEGNR